MPEKKINQAVLSRQNDLSSLVLQNRSPKYWRTIRNTFGLFEKHFSEANEPKKAPKYISVRKVSGLFLRNEHQFIPWRLRFQAWLNLYITFISNVDRIGFLPFRKSRQHSAFNETRSYWSSGRYSLVNHWLTSCINMLMNK